MSKIFLKGGRKLQVSCSLEVLGSQTGFPKALKKKSKNSREKERLTFLKFKGMGVEHFGISEGKQDGREGGKMFMLRMIFSGITH